MGRAPEPSARLSLTTLTLHGFCYIFSFRKPKFLPNLRLALIDCLEALAGEHVDFFGREIGFEQAAEFAMFMSILDEEEKKKAMEDEELDSNEDDDWF